MQRLLINPGDNQENNHDPTSKIKSQKKECITCLQCALRQDILDIFDHICDHDEDDGGHGEELHINADLYNENVMMNMMMP